MPKYYEITLIGRLDPHWSGGFSDLDFTQLEEDEILLLGILPDQATLHNLLEQIRDLFMDRLRLRDYQAGACLERLNSAGTADAVPGRRLHRAGDQGNQRAEVVTGLLRQW